MMPGKPPSGFLTLGPPSPLIPEFCSTCAYRRKNSCSAWSTMIDDGKGWQNMELNEAWEELCESNLVYKQSFWSKIVTTWKLWTPVWGRM